MLMVENDQSVKDWNSFRQGTIAALDVGTTKVSCFIAKCGQGPAATKRPIRVLGVGHHISQGIRKGAVVNMEPVEDAIRNAVEGAEKIANTTIRQVVLNLSTGSPSSAVVTATTSLGGRAVSNDDVKDVLLAARAQAEAQGRTVVHAIPLNYAIDGNAGIRDPRGMYGEKLSVQMHVSTAASAPIQNLALCVERCHLELSGLVLSPYASGLSCLVNDEAELGAVCVDMGGGTTSFSIFHESACLYSDVIPVGGVHVTNDIARGLSTSVAVAERLKTLFGSALSSPNDHREMIDVPQIGEDTKAANNRVPRAMLTGIIQPRLEEIFEMVRDRLKASGFEAIVGKRMVLTGGASQLTGARELATQILDKNVRMGRPLRIEGMPDAMSGPGSATVSGLLEYAFRAPAEATLVDYASLRASKGPTRHWKKLARWLSD